MTNTISVGRLRQNPTDMLRDVRSGAVYTVTDHGRPVAEVSPIRHSRWIPAEDVDRVLRGLGADDAWADEITADRASVDMPDPWEDAK